MKTMHPSRFNKIFGSGPLGLIFSLALLYIPWWINRWFGLPHISDNSTLLNGIFIGSVVLTVVIIVWSVISLPGGERGNKLCTGGAFRYVRHPLYAAFLSVFDFGLAMYLNSYIFIVWAVLLHPLWHFLIRYEESLMIGIFGDEYREYAKRTGRFVPRVGLGNAVYRE